MAEARSMQVIVARVIHGEGEAGQWHPIGYADSLEEADAALNQLLERERAELHQSHPQGEREYDVWSVPEVWSVLESATGR